MILTFLNNILVFRFCLQGALSKLSEMISFRPLGTTGWSSAITIQSIDHPSSGCFFTPTPRPFDRLTKSGIIPINIYASTKKSAQVVCAIGSHLQMPRICPMFVRGLPVFGHFLVQRIHFSDFYVKHNKESIIEKT